MRDTILEICEEIRGDIDFESEKALVTDHVLESFDIVNLVAQLSDEFDIKIRSKDLVNENFDSLDAICKMVARLVED